MNKPVTQDFQRVKARLKFSYRVGFVLKSIISTTKKKVQEKREREIGETKEEHK